MIELYSKVYNPQKYHCVHFVIDAAKAIHNKDYTPCFFGLTGSLDESVKTSRTTVHKNKRIDLPIDACIVLMTKQDNGSHVGLYYQNRIFHLTEMGVHLITIEQAKQFFKRIRYYEPNLHY